MKGRTTFIIAHRLSTVRQSDLVVVLENGRIIEKDSHTALMQRDSVYAGMYRSQHGTSARSSLNVEAPVLS